VRAAAADADAFCTELALLKDILAAFLLRVVVEVAPKPGALRCEPSSPSVLLAIAHFVVLLALPAFAFPLVTICYSAPPPPSDPASAAYPAATADVELRALAPPPRRPSPPLTATTSFWIISFIS
jgi:hypothetical protein